jgi:hypothetical protein
MHMPVVTSDGDVLRYDLFPERQEPPVSALVRRWEPDVRAALLPVARRSPAAKLLRKGLPIPNSLRYLGLQFQRACAAGGDDILVDVCKAHALGLCGGEPIGVDTLIARWRSTSSVLYADTLASMRSADLQAVLSLFLHTMVEVDVCNHRLLRAGISHMDSLGMIDLLLRICKPAAGCLPSVGFGICMERAAGIEVQQSLLNPSGGVASAKRIRAKLSVTPELKSALGRRVAAMSVPGVCPLPRLQAEHQRRFPATKALLCDGCGWLRSPLGKGGIEVDVDTGRVACGKCAGPVQAVPVNGNQLMGPNLTVARMCDSCGVVVSRFHPYGVGVRCAACASAAKPGSYRPSGARMPRRTAWSNRRSSRR